MVFVRKVRGSNTYVYEVVRGKWRYIGKEKPIDYWINKIHQGDCLELLAQMPSESIDMIMFSPPYYGLRDYGEAANKIWGGDPTCKHEWMEYVKPKERGSYGESSWHRPSRDHEAKWKPQTSSFCKKCGAWYGQLGLEPDYRMYLDHMVEIFKELKRVLKKTGSIYIVIGDTYASSRGPSKQGIQPKSLMMIPERLAIRLVDELGLILRNKIIWLKLNAMPESVKDRLARKYEFIFHFVKSRRYYYNLDNIRIPWQDRRKTDIKRALEKHPGYDGKHRNGEARGLRGGPVGNPLRGKNPGDVVKHDIAVGRIGNYSYSDPLHTKPYHPKGKNPGDIVRFDSKFLRGDVKTASPGARAIRTLVEGKLTTKVKRKIRDVGAYLKQKKKESGYTMRELAELTGIKKTTLEHYFRTDFSGQALPDRETWNKLKPLLNLGEYDEFIDEEIKSALPQPHPKGRNPGDYLEVSTRPLKEAHYAPYPIDICLYPILSSCPPDGVLLDPMCGSGTTLLAAELINRGMWSSFRLPVNEIAKSQKWNIKYIGFEIVPEYIEIAYKRLRELR